MSTHFTVSREFLKWNGDKSWVGTRVHYRYILLDYYRDELIIYLDKISVEERESTRHKWQELQPQYDRLKYQEEPIVSKDISEQVLEMARKSLVIKPWSSRNR